MLIAARTSPGSPCATGDHDDLASPSGGRLNNEIANPVAVGVWLAAAGVFATWYQGRLRECKETRAADDGSEDSRKEIDALRHRVTIECFVGLAALIGLYLGLDLLF